LLQQEEEVFSLEVSCCPHHHRMSSMTGAPLLQQEEEVFSLEVSCCHQMRRRMTRAPLLQQEEEVFLLEEVFCCHCHQMRMTIELERVVFFSH
jgi:hypothetical protein